MSRFYVPPENIKGNLIYIDGMEAHHILNVMRLKKADKVVVFDGTGKEYTSFIKEARRGSLLAEIVKTKTAPRGLAPDITLAQALPKKAKMDFIIEKAVELGVNSVIPIVTQRTVVKPDEEKAPERLRRWQNIALNAAKQCGRTDIPKIEDIRKFYFALDKIDSYDLAMLACLSEKTINIRKALSQFRNGKIILFIGPEGDFTTEEISMALEANCKLISLGPLVLKADTASLAAISILQHELSA